MKIPRRSFLTGVSAIALFGKGTAAHAWFSHGKPTSSPTPTGKFIQVAAASGQTEITGDEYVFANYLQDCTIVGPGTFGGAATGTTAWPGIVDINGIPSSTAGLNSASTITANVGVAYGKTDPSTVWVFAWTGRNGNSSTNNSGMALNFGCTVNVGGTYVNGSTSSSLNTRNPTNSVDGYIEFTFTRSHDLGTVFVRQRHGAGWDAK